MEGLPLELFLKKCYKINIFKGWGLYGNVQEYGDSQESL
jgi:hypothetical protein